MQPCLQFSPAVTIVTAGLASTLFGSFIDIKLWALVILIICIIILFLGKYKVLDKFIKIIIITLTVSTLVAVTFAFTNYEGNVVLTQILPINDVEIIFLIALMGWMPAPLDISVWHSLWTIEKKRTEKIFTPKSALLDFNIGYIGTIILGICFLLLGYLVMFNSNESFSNAAGVFSNQLISMYTQSLGSWSYIIIGIASFTTMFSTTLTTLDASPRAMSKTVELLTNKVFKKGYLFWILTLFFGTVLIFFCFASEMGLLIKIATILSFLTAPFYAIINYILISSKHTPKEWHPSKKLHVLSILGILFLISFSIWYITIL